MLIPTAVCHHLLRYLLSASWHEVIAAILGSDRLLHIGEMLMVQIRCPCWHAAHHEAGLELLGGGWHRRPAHHISRVAAHERSHVRRRAEHPLRRHELLLVATAVHCWGTHHVGSATTTIVVKLLLWIIHVPIFSCFV